MKDLTPEAQWYNEYYRTTFNDMAAWNQFLLPELHTVLKPGMRLLELGCGQGSVLKYVAGANLLEEENIYGFDQSKVAIEQVRQCLPRANLSAADIRGLSHPPGFFNVCLLMETIEHLVDPMPVLEQIHHVLAPGGILYLSFPNYLHFPWWVVRILAEKLNRHNWISLQPIDKIYTIFSVTRFARNAGFRLEKGVGTTYCLPMPPRYLRLFEPPALTKALNALRLWWLSFHPILKLRKLDRKPARTSGSPSRR